MKKIIVATYSLSTLVMLVVVFVFSGTFKKTTASTMALDTEAKTETVMLELHEMPASQLKETLLADLKNETSKITGDNDIFYLEHSHYSPKLLACLLMAIKEHAKARQLLESHEAISLDQLNTLRNHMTTKDAMKSLELLEGKRMKAVAPEIIAIIEKFDVQPAENDTDERIREIAKTLKHIAFIPDGNRRWAKERGLDRSEGHKEGFLNVAPRLILESWRLGIHTFTLWCCSTSNIEKRDPEEVEYFLYCFENMIKNLLPIAKQYQARIIHLGRKDRIPQSLLDTIQKAETETAMFNKHILNVAIDYSGNYEIINACKNLMRQGYTADDLTDELLTASLNTANQPYPNPDFTIRTGNELRVSGFMSWQIGYSELYFTPKHFPAFDLSSLKEALLDFGSRKRRLGK